VTLSGAATVFANRLAEVDTQLTHVSSLESAAIAATKRGTAPAFPPERHLAAAFALLLMYASLEQGITSSIREALQFIAARAIRLRDLEQALYSIALAPEFDSARETTRKRWESRAEILRRQVSSDACPINDAVFDNELQTTRVALLRTIFDALGIPAPEVPTPSCGTYLEDVKDRRNEIAHGRESAIAVGGRFPHSELLKRRDAVRDAVTYFISTLEGWGTAKEFAKASERGRY
jgi:hypothetical protein